ELVLKYGGALSGEHGDGLVRSPFQEKMYGPALYGAFRELKRTLDPLNLLNPGKIVDAPPLATNLRYGPAYVTPDVPTTFDFGADGGSSCTSIIRNTACPGETGYLGTWPALPDRGCCRGWRAPDLAAGSTRNSSGSTGG